MPSSRVAETPLFLRHWKKLLFSGLAARNIFEAIELQVALILQTDSISGNQ